jgi:hypothetical protein
LDYFGTGTGTTCDPSWFNPDGDDDYSEGSGSGNGSGGGKIVESYQTFGRYGCEGTNGLPSPAFPPVNPLLPTSRKEALNNLFGALDAIALLTLAESLGSSKGLGALIKGLLERGAVGRELKGLSVIGPRDTYVDYTKKIGANFLDLKGEPWNWGKNLEYLQGVVTRGDDVVFAGKFDPTRLQPSALKDEIDYLTSNGYRWVEDFSRMVK